MKNTYHFSFQVTFPPDNPDYGQYPGAVADIWVLGNSIEQAEEQARHYLDEHMCQIVSLDASGKTGPSQYNGKPLGLAEYNRAQKYGIALSLTAWNP